MYKVWYDTYILIKGVTYMNNLSSPVELLDKLNELIYQEYISDYRSIIFENWSQADSFFEYLKKNNHKIDGVLKTRLTKSMGKDCVHVCEPYCDHKKRGFKL